MIENEILNYLSIYPYAINDVDDTVERICGMYGIQSDDHVWPYVKQWFEEEVFGDNLTNAIIDTIFRNLRDALVESGQFESDQIDWYVNGLDSHFIINDKEF